MVLFCYGWAFFVTAMLGEAKILLYDVDGLLLGKDYSPLIYSTNIQIAETDE